MILVRLNFCIAYCEEGCSLSVCANVVGVALHRIVLDHTYNISGLSLTTASTVYMLDPVWSAADEAQALNRAHRIGQVC